MISETLISICIPTFNGAKYLKDALECVKMQTYDNIEVIISDDASTDNTLEIVEVFKNEVSFPVYIFHHPPQGIGANWNNCVIHANGELIKFLFQDDLLEPTCIEEMVNPFLEKKNLGLVFSKRKIIFDSYNKEHIAWIEKYGNLHKAWRKIKPIQKGRSLLRDPNLLKEPENKVGEPTSVLLSKRVFERVGFFDTNLKQALDFGLTPYSLDRFLKKV